MPITNIWIHLIFSTKKRESLITIENKENIIRHIKENAIEKNIHIDFINCVKDHIHILLSLGANQSIAKVSQLIKGESSHWINNCKICKTKFEWQEEYIALSVSASAVNKVREYIKNQEEHHKRKSFSDEYTTFLNLIQAIHQNICKQTD